MERIERPSVIPTAPMVRMLLLTGQRKTEVAEAQWSEFDFEKKLWIIPPGRMKMDAAHVVPLTAEAIAVLQDCRASRCGGFVFSTTFGRMPVNGFSKAKARLDKLIERRSCPTFRRASFTISGGPWAGICRRCRSPTWFASW